MDAKRKLFPEAREQWENLFSLVSERELREWIRQLTADSAEVRERLRAWLTERFLKMEATYEAAREKVQHVFLCENGLEWKETSRYSNADWLTDRDDVMPELELVLLQAEEWVKSGHADAALGVALQVFCELEKTVDDDVLHGYVGGVFECAERAQAVLKSAVRTRALSERCVQEMLLELRRLAVAPNLTGDGLELTPLFLWCCERCLKREGTLGMLDSLMEDPANACDWQKLHLLERRMELLRKWGREEEIPPLIQKYLYIPELRKREVTRLMQQQQWTAALILVQEGIVLAEHAYHFGIAEDWKKLKITLLQKTGQDEAALTLCRERFMENGAQEADYRKLKSMVPPKEWKSYLRKAISEMHNEESRNLLPIYVEENMHKELAALLHSPRIDIPTLVQYMRKVDISYLPKLLRHFEQRVDESLRMAGTREWYAQMSTLLHRARTLPGGNALIDRMLEKYRSQYRRCSAMLEEFRNA